MLFNEPKLLKFVDVSPLQTHRCGFSALQRAEIAEIETERLLIALVSSFSALQRAEIAEMQQRRRLRDQAFVFQCSSTSRNC